MFRYILILCFCQILPDSEDEYEREYTDLSNFPIDLISEEYPYEKPNDYSHTWNHLFNNKLMASYISCFAFSNILLTHHILH